MYHRYTNEYFVFEFFHFEIRIFCDIENSLQIYRFAFSFFRLTYERDELLREIREKLFLFDAVLRLLRHEKIHLDVTLKNAELRYV